MADQELVNYIKQTLAAGFSEDQIKDAIKKQGWPEEEIKTAFLEIKEPKPVTPPFVTEAEKKPEVKAEIKPEVKPEEKPEEKVITSIETLFGAPVEAMPEAKPTEMRPLAVPAETIKTEEIKPEIKLEEVKAAKSIEQLITGAGDVEKVAAVPMETPPKASEKIETKQETISEKPEIQKTEVAPKKPKGPLALKIAVIILGIALIALATYCLIFSPQLFVPLERLFK